MFGVSLNRAGNISLARQIYLAFKNNIVTGILKPGEPVPSTRELAQYLDVSRSTVNEAYDMLICEGFILSHQGVWSKVAGDLYLKEYITREQAAPSKKTKPVIKYDFRTGQPDYRNFPQKQWKQSLNYAIDDMQYSHFGYSKPQGIKLLREEISAWLFRSRSISTDPNDIFITAGATQALYILSKVLCGANGTMLVEDPCHVGMLKTLQNNGINTVAVPVDESGMQTERILKEKAQAVYVTPSHQFPLGSIMSAQRRAALIRYARSHGMYIIEDDYDSEFRFCGAKIAPLYSYDQDHVIYVGTFSKILFPALRIGYVVLPKRLHNSWKGMRTYMDVHNPVLEQGALVDFLQSRKLDRHILKMSRQYQRSRDHLLSVAGQNAKKNWQLYGDSAGLHIVMSFTGKRFDKQFFQYCLDNEIYVSPVDYYCIKHRMHLDKLVLGYAHLTEQEITEGMTHLLALIREYNTNT